MHRPDQLSLDLEDDHNGDLTRLKLNLPDVVCCAFPFDLVETKYRIIIAHTHTHTFKFIDLKEIFTNLDMLAEAKANLGEPYSQRFQTKA